MFVRLQQRARAVGCEHQPIINSNGDADCHIIGQMLGEALAATYK